jgi:hypothetical protein
MVILEFASMMIIKQLSIHLTLLAHDVHSAECSVKQSWINFFWCSHHSELCVALIYVHFVSSGKQSIHRNSFVWNFIVESECSAVTFKEFDHMDRYTGIDFKLVEQSSVIWTISHINLFQIEISVNQNICWVNTWESFSNRWFWSLSSSLILIISKIVADWTVNGIFLSQRLSHRIISFGWIYGNKFSLY